ncbi:MAG: hypothetical protein LBG11_10235 [Bifidobacteriaceae bacterium]|nr:hypothetical protein [Bifidobacteriaceae bacterium]
MRQSVARSITAWVGAAIWCAAPVTAYFYLTDRANDESFNAPVAVNDVVRENDSASVRDVQLILTWHTPPPVVAPDWTGVVQAVEITADQEIKSGQTVTRIDGIDRFACASSYPLARPLTLKDSGQDVVALHECLALFGYDVDSDGSAYGTKTRQAVTDLGKRIGAVGADGTGFDPAWIVFLPEENYVPAAVHLELGAPAPPAGTHIAEPTPALTQAVLVTPGTVDLVDVDLDQDGDENLGATRQPVNVPEDELLPAEADEILLVSGSEIPVTEDRSEVAADGLAALGQMMTSGSTSIDGRLSRPSGTDELVVASAAVVTTQDGTTCVLRVDGSALQPVAIEVIGDTQGKAIVAGELNPGDEVRVAPTAQDRTCD